MISGTVSIVLIRGQTWSLSLCFSITHVFGFSDAVTVGIFLLFYRADLKSLPRPALMIREWPKLFNVGSREFNELLKQRFAPFALAVVEFQPNIPKHLIELHSWPLPEHPVASFA